MKRVEVDTNFNWLGAGCPALTQRRAEELGLSVGERVVAYQDDDEWPGIVRFDPTLPHQYQWYVVLD